MRSGRGPDFGTRVQSRQRIGPPSLRFTHGALGTEPMDRHGLVLVFDTTSHAALVHGGGGHMLAAARADRAVERGCAHGPAAACPPLRGPPARTAPPLSAEDFGCRRMTTP